MINRDLLYYDTFETFNSLKLSANQFNTRYTIGVSGDEQEGEPLIAWKTAVFIATPHLMIWLRGKLWDIEAYDAYGLRYTLEESVGDALDRLINQLTNKQDKLIVGQNLKTINGYSILGKGDLKFPVAKKGDKLFSLNDTDIGQDDAINLRSVNGYSIVGEGDIPLPMGMTPEEKEALALKQQQQDESISNNAAAIASLALEGVSVNVTELTLFTMHESAYLALEAAGAVTDGVYATWEDDEEPPSGSATYDEATGIITIPDATYDEETGIITLPSASYDEATGLIQLK